MKKPLKEQLCDSLAPYLPEAVVDFAANFLIEHRVQLTLSRNRATKLGDYRHPWQGKGHRISVNQNLNRYAFAVTLIHEFAHLLVWEQYKGKVLPHGTEWKSCFAELMQPFLNARVFPDELLPALQQYFHAPKASSCSDPGLMRALSAYDQRPEHVKLLEEIPHDTVFATKQLRFFKKLEKRRSRYLCVEIKTGKQYLIHQLAEVYLKPQA
ncbi:MAG: SprT-like domain-containing protein [Bacteroidia bacterium]